MCGRRSSNFAGLIVRKRRLPRGVFHRSLLRGWHRLHITRLREPISMRCRQQARGRLQSLDCRLAGSPSFRRFLYLDEAAGMDVIDVPVNRNVFGYERMFTYSAYVLHDACGLILDRVPFQKVSRI